MDSSFAVEVVCIPEKGRNRPEHFFRLTREEIWNPLQFPQHPKI